MQFVHSHPDVNSIFVREAGLALREAGWPCRAVTGYVDQPTRPWRRLLARIGNLVGFDLDREFRRRQLKSSPWDEVDTAPFWELMRISTLRLGMDVRLGDVFFHRSIRSIERRAIAAFDAATTHVYCYEYSACETFEAASRRGIRTVYEVPSPEYAYVERLLAAEAGAFPELKSGVDRYFERRRAARLARRAREWQLADLVIVNSSFTLRTFADAGFDTTKAVIVPCGAPEATNLTQDRRDGGRVFRFLWAGTFSARKGAHHLLDAWRQRPRDGAELHVCGAWTLPERLRSNLPPSIVVHGSVPQTELFEHYGNADILVFPTLCDGFGMVVTEAFSRGLPVITTEQAGAADLIVSGKNGFVVPAGDVERLTTTLNWCADHPADVAAMRPHALETARRRPWSAYRAGLREAISGLAGSARAGV